MVTEAINSSLNMGLPFSMYQVRQASSPSSVCDYRTSNDEKVKAESAYALKSFLRTSQENSCWKSLDVTDHGWTEE